MDVTQPAGAHHLSEFVRGWERRDRLLKERRAEAAADMRADPLVASLGDYFGARVDPDGVQPTGTGPTPPAEG